MERLSKGERTAQRILDVAETLFAARGYRGTTLREIAAAARIQEPGLYNHFKGKEQLFHAMLDRALHPLEQAIDRQLLDPGKLATLPDLITDLLAEHPHIPALFQQALMAPEDNPGHTLVLGWLDTLMQKGLLTMTGTRKPGLDDGLKMLAMFNLAAGYFTAAPLLQRMTGKQALQKSVLEKQKALCKRLILDLFAQA